ncbi:MAG: pitrilysin family protein [Pseudomonadota bacterium]
MMKLHGKITVVLSALIWLAVSQMAVAIEIKSVESSTGVKALLVEDYTLPLVSFSYSFSGGTSQDPPAKSGAVRLMSALIDEGAGDLDSIAFRAKLEEMGIEFGFSSSQDFLSGSMRFLREDKDTAFQMLKLALTEPRFDNDAIERMRDAILTGIVRSKTNPGSVASVAMREALFGQHPYSRRSSGDEESVKAITRDDIVTLHQSLFAQDTLVVGVVGAISEEELKTAMDEIFGSLPQKSGASVISEIEPNLGESISIEMPVPNSRVTLIYKGLKRDDPDFFAAHLMNHILGGGSFSSRLYTEVREKRGLAYSVSSGISTFKNASFLAAGTSTRTENQDEVIAVIRGEIDKIATEGVTQEELDAAKKFVSGAYAISNLDTSRKIANVLVALQTQNLGIDYIDRRKEFIANVTLEDVNRVAKKLLGVEPTQILVGPATQ